MLTWDRSALGTGALRNTSPAVGYVRAGASDCLNPFDTYTKPTQICTYSVEIKHSEEEKNTYHYIHSTRQITTDG